MNVRLSIFKIHPAEGCEISMACAEFKSKTFELQVRRLNPLHQFNVIDIEVN